VRKRGGQGELLGDVRGFMDDLLKAFIAAERRALDLEDEKKGRDLSRADIEEEMRVLCVDADERVYKALRGANVLGFAFSYAQSGGEALDRASNSRFHLALVGPNTHDMPGELVLRAITSQSPEIIVISYAPGGKLEIVDRARRIPIADKFTKITQITERLGELAEAHRAKGRERRYLQSVRERHFELLRRFAELKRKLEKAG
jgi:DNA-binding NtrC family response regulator